MLTVTVKGIELYDADKGLFYNTKDTVLKLEFSLVSISKWESIWKKPFLTSQGNFTAEEYISFLECMTITQNVDPMIYKTLSQENLLSIKNYCEDSMTATTFKTVGSRSREVITAELVYYWMFSLQIPKECEKWHFNKLMTLIRVFTEKNQKPKKMSKSDIYARQKALNAKNRARYHSKG